MTIKQSKKKFFPDYEGIREILTPEQRKHYNAIGNDEWRLYTPFKKVFDWYATDWETKTEEFRDKDVEWKHLHLLCEIAHECILSGGHLCCPYTRLLSKPLDYNDNFLKQKVTKGEYTKEKRLEIIRNSKKHNAEIPKIARELIWMGLVLLTIEKNTQPYALYFQLTDKGLNHVKEFGEKGGSFLRWNEIPCIASRIVKTYEEYNSTRKEPRPVLAYC